MPLKALHRAILLACLSAMSLSLCAATVAANPVELPASVRPALAVLVREILDGNPGVQAAQAALNAAQARARAADQPLYNPQLALDLEQAEEDTQALGLSQALDWADKRGARAEVAEFKQDEAGAELVATGQKLALELLSVLTRFQTVQALAQLTQRRADLMQRFAFVSQQRLQAGDLNQMDLEVARLAYAQARLQNAQAVSDMIEARQALIALTGYADRRWPVLPMKLPTVEQDASELKPLLNDLAIVRAQRARIAAAQSMIQLRVRQRRPDPIIGLRGGREEDETLVGLNLSLPLFVRNTFSAEVDAANAKLIQAQQQARNAYRRARARFVSALSQYRVIHRAWFEWKRIGQQSLRNQIELLKRLWRAGELSTTDYLVRLNQALDTQASAIELHGRAWQAWFEWLTASRQLGRWLGLRAP
jgi:cobalt-zinc-cadmium efflux system outer membrane protein